MQIEWRDVRTFGQALLLSVLLDILCLPMFRMIPGWYDGSILANLITIAVSIACILAGLVFLRRRMKTTSWVLRDVVFVVTCIGAGFFLTAVCIWISGDGL